MATKVITYNIDAERVLKRLKNKMNNNPVKVNDAIHKSGFILEGEIKNSIAGRRAEHRSVDTGHFLQTVNTDNSEELKSKVYSPVNYSIFLEEGTSRMRPRKHFKNSFIRIKPNILRLISESLKD